MVDESTRHRWFKRRTNLDAFRAFVRFVLVWICRLSLPLGVWEGLRFVIVALPGLFSYLFKVNNGHLIKYLFIVNVKHVNNLQVFVGCTYLLNVFIKNLFL